MEVKPTEGPWGPRAALPGRPAPSPSVPGPPGRPGLGPLRGPLPAPGQAVLMRGRPALPRGSRGARVCPAGRPASVTGRPALGTGPGNHLWVTRRLLSSWGTPSSTDLAWMPGRPSRGGWGLPRRGQEGTASLCRCTAARVPRKGGLCPLSAGTQGFGRPRVRTPLELGASDGADTERYFSLFQLKLLEPLAVGGSGCGERCPRGAEPRGDPRGLPGDRQQGHLDPCTTSRRDRGGTLVPGPRRAAPVGPDVLMCRDVDGRWPPGPPGPSCRTVFISLPSTPARAHSE